MPSKAKGMSLVEILIAIALTGILAILTVPQMIINQNQINAGIVQKTEQIMQGVGITMQIYEDDNGKTAIDLGTITYESIMYKYGNYFAYKPTGAGTYYLLPDGSRLTTTPQIFSDVTAPANLQPEYNPAPLPKDQWRATGAAAGTEAYCGDYPSNECVYLDTNGNFTPNQIGKDGDIIPFRIDPATTKIRTLYQWEQASGSVDACRFVSGYDVKSGATGASGC